MSNNNTNQEEKNQQPPYSQPHMVYYNEAPVYYQQQHLYQQPQQQQQYFYASSQQQQHLYQVPPQQAQYTQFQTFVPVQPPSLQNFNDPVTTEPDEFIIDLLRKPQERLFLLKLELELETFVKDESKLRLDLPGMNSYQRLMVHKLAPYYKLNHYHDAMRKAVYVCKTFITELPSTRLQDVRLDDDNLDTNNANDDSNINKNNDENTTNSEEQPTPQFKIMRRSAGSSPSSRNNSTSEAKESRKNMTLEERKTAYEEARARIFQNLDSTSNKKE